MRSFTDEQADAIARRSGELILDANAGSGKTSVLVERFVQAVREDGVEVSAILAITFTEKAAAELRERIRARFEELGAQAQARSAERAAISTIHGFCARLLRAQALAAGLDPGFAVLSEPEAAALSDGAFEAALADLAADPGGRELIAAYGVPALRETTLATHARLRSAGEREPRLPDLGRGPDPAAARAALLAAADAVARELGALPEPGKRVLDAIERLAGCRALCSEGEMALPWPGELSALALPGGNGAALSTDACAAYSAALERFRLACDHAWGAPVIDAAGRLLAGYGERYAAGKRSRGALDFEDLELFTRDLLASREDVRGRLRERFALVMVDELQDTNRVQMQLIEHVADGNLFTVGDALQSIYGFRHAEVSLFEDRRRRLAARGEHATLRINFRSRREILDALNIAFEPEFGDRFTPLVAGRADAPAAEPCVELLVAEKGAEWSAAAQDELVAPWRLAEARALAARVAELVHGGAAPREIVVLTRASTDLRAYERALEDRGVPTYVIGGRGYWAHPQVLDLVSYLRALANPLDEEALLTVLASPLAGVGDDGLVLVAAAARAAGRDPWSVIRDGDAIAGLSGRDRERLERFTGWFADEREIAPRTGAEELIDRALGWSGYDLAMLAMPGGERRLANVRKLMRLAREHEAAAGTDLWGFARTLRARGDALAGDSREGEAPVEGEALDAVRLMTIHRAKGLEFPIVCVADLGRCPRPGSELLRLGDDGRIGLRLARAGGGGRISALDYEALGQLQAARDAAEERRLFFVAMTRARERLILSGAARFDKFAPAPAGGPIGWIGPALVPDLAERLLDARQGIVEREQGEWRAAVALSLMRPGDAEGGAAPAPGRIVVPEIEPSGVSEPAPAPVAIETLSYSGLAEHSRCGYRFYLERVVGLTGEPPAPAGPGGVPGWSAAERGTAVHAVLERLDLRAPRAPGYAELAELAAALGLPAPRAQEAEAVSEMVTSFASCGICARLAAARRVRREERFAFELWPAGGPLMTGVFDVVAEEAGGTLLVVDYKTDRLEGAEPAAIVERFYARQRLIYAAAALAQGARRVEVAHVFLERAGEPALATYGAADRDRLLAELRGAAAGVLAGEFAVSAEPHRALCAGCPGEGGLCSWPVELTRRETVGTLF